MQEFNYSKTIHFLDLHWLEHKTRNLIIFDTGMIQLEKDLRISGDLLLLYLPLAISFET